MNEHADRDRSEQPPVDLTGWENGYANAGSPESPQAAGGGHGDPVHGEPRTGLYAAAVYDVAVDHPMWIGDDSKPLEYNPDREVRLGDFVDEAARAAISVADVEVIAMARKAARRITEERREVKRLRRWKAEATEVILGLQDLGRALGLRPGEQITGRSATEAAMRLTARAEAAEAKVARVEALIDEWDGEVGAQEDYQPAGEIRVLKACLADLCTALAGPEPEATDGSACPDCREPNVHHAACPRATEGGA